jgi:hypothetical protein
MARDPCPGPARPTAHTPTPAARSARHPARVPGHPEPRGSGIHYQIAKRRTKGQGLRRRMIPAARSTQHRVKPKSSSTRGQSSNGGICHGREVDPYRRTRAPTVQKRSFPRRRTASAEATQPARPQPMSQINVAPQALSGGCAALRVWDTCLTLPMAPSPGWRLAMPASPPPSSTSTSKSTRSPRPAATTCSPTSQRRRRRAGRPPGVGPRP